MTIVPDGVSSIIGIPIRAICGLLSSHAALQLLACLTLAMPAMAGTTKTVELHDYLGVAWQHELVHYPLDFARGELKSEAVAWFSPKAASQFPAR